MRTVFLFAALLLISVLLFSTGIAQAGRSEQPYNALEREGVIHGWAFDDLNKDGIRETYDFGLAGTVICLTDEMTYAESYSGCDYTEWGEFEWDMLYPGVYQVELTQWPDGYFLVSPNPVTVVLPEGPFVQRVDFALSNDPEGVIRGIAFVDADRDGFRDPFEPDLDGVQVCLVGHNWCIYTEYGEYEFDLLPPGEYTVRLQEFPKGYHPTSSRKVHITLADAEIRSDVDFGFRQDNRKIK